MKAYKLFNLENDDCDFEEGTIPQIEHIEADYFFIQTAFEKYQLSAHPAPRYQFVITLKGKLKFTVSNGNYFIIEPGVVLLAKDTKGIGHTWEILDGNVWERIYIVPKSDASDHFISISI